MFGGLDQAAVILLLMANGASVRYEPMVVTAYTDNGNDDITASLHRTGPGVCAATDDWAFGQMFHVPGYGWCQVWDRGLLAQHNIDADLWFPTRAEALEWGRRQVDVMVVE